MNANAFMSHPHTRVAISVDGGRRYAFSFDISEDFQAECMNLNDFVTRNLNERLFGYSGMPQVVITHLANVQQTSIYNFVSAIIDRKYDFDNPIQAYTGSYMKAQADAAKAKTSTSTTSSSSQAGDSNFDPIVINDDMDHDMAVASMILDSATDSFDAANTSYKLAAEAVDAASAAFEMALAAYNHAKKRYHSQLDDVEHPSTQVVEDSDEDEDATQADDDDTKERPLKRARKEIKDDQDPKDSDPLVHFYHRDFDLAECPTPNHEMALVTFCEYQMAHDVTCIHCGSKLPVYPTLSFCANPATKTNILYTSGIKFTPTMPSLVKDPDALFQPDRTFHSCIPCGLKLGEIKYKSDQAQVVPASSSS